MISSPQVGDRVQVWYGASNREHMPHHGRLGTVTVPSRGKPRNHGVRLDGYMNDAGVTILPSTIVVPAGNLRRPK